MESLFTKKSGGKVADSTKKNSRTESANKFVMSFSAASKLWDFGTFGIRKIARCKRKTASANLIPNILLMDGDMLSRFLGRLLGEKIRAFNVNLPPSPVASASKFHQTHRHAAAQPRRNIIGCGLPKFVFYKCDFNTFVLGRKLAILTVVFRLINTRIFPPSSKAKQKEKERRGMKPHINLSEVHAKPNTHCAPFRAPNEVQKESRTDQQQKCMKSFWKSHRWRRM